MTKEQFENWKTQTIDQLAELKKKRIILYKKFCKEFDSQVLTLLYQVDSSFKQLKEVCDNGCIMFEIESENDNQ